MSYKVTQYHHRKAIIKGDLCAETIIESVDMFSSKKGVMLFLHEQVLKATEKGFKSSLINTVKDKMPELTIYANTKWIHENTGEEHQEYYWFKTEKC